MRFARLCRTPLAGCVALLSLASLLNAAWAAPISEADILGQADARIEKHRKADATLVITGPDGKPLPAGTKVRIEQTRHAFLFGANIFMLARHNDPKLNEAYGQRFAELLNFATLPFYWWAYETEQGKPDYARTEAIIHWCRQHNIICKGHPLAWNYVDPKWLPKDSARVIQLQMERITACVSRFKDDIGYWDVVNEATHYDRDTLKKNAPLLTEAITQIGVPAFIQQAFKTARQANPDAVLIINDYRTDADYIDKVITKLVGEEGQPLYDVIGIQCHQHGKAWSAQKTWEICERFAKFGKPLHFTEATILSGKLGWELASKNPNEPWTTTPEGEKRQAEEVARFYTVLFSHPAVEAITWWDFSDAGAWQQAPAGFLRKDMTPKPAYDVLRGLIKGKWWTTTEVTVGDGGRASFRGFFGDYRITGVEPGRPAAGTFTLKKGQDGPIEVYVK
ncbi:MAG TPA: endo-1,4-beta-xylanase [Phycisphaerae bacterium]|nr:1,4-beta-xylanase [Phycisphaerae bacterium]HOB73332.1 endo-1,4-beta-xylanase [Phycisphaerae bacterium]HOJ55426.1 endo-1,4-beta-xylanase [Phycisphaerae bacterium]HOL24974.1 endo-1,4-beta-xylanase [Phycisphaerae bacterium]HPP20076.1 endo-1,4-beta-xylanase [Phycisphaerae bacterium]